MRSASTALLFLVLSVGGCSEEASDGGSPLLELSVSETIGQLTLQAEGTDAGASGVFYSSWSPDRTLHFGPFDECFPLWTGTDTVVEMNVGPEITFSYGGSLLSATATVTTGGGYYNGYSADGPFPTGVEYTVSIPGAGTVDAVSFGLFAPGAVSPAPLPTIVPGEPFEIEFNEGSGADWIRISVSDSSGGNAHACLAEDDGSFTVPGDISELIGANPNVNVAAWAITVVEMEGKLAIATAVR